MKYFFSVAMTIVIVTAVLWPGSDLPEPGIPAVDKIVHFLLFAGWTIAIIHDFDLKWPMSLTAGLLFSLFTEVIQLATDDRTFDLTDILADSVGIVFGSQLPRSL